jgi:hypothetical protein
MSHDDVEVPKPSPLIPFVGLWVMVAGITMLVTGLQILDIQGLPWWLKPMPVLMMAMGLATSASGGMVVRTRFWAVVLAIGLAGLQGFVCLLWVIYTAFHGFFSALPVVCGFTSLAALVLAPLAIGPTRRFSRARAALLEDLE